VSVRCSRTDHPPETLAFCLDDGEHRVAYSADTGPGWDFTDFMTGGGGRSPGRPVDLVICEATFREGQGGHDPVHMTAAEAGRAAKGAEARRLVITHLLPGADVEGARAEAEDAYGAAVEVARSGLVLIP
jgi:ribonuclease BN (tRNA processing enzyme)